MAFLGIINSFLEISYSDISCELFCENNSFPLLSNDCFDDKGDDDDDTNLYSVSYVSFGRLSIFRILTTMKQIKRYQNINKSLNNQKFVKKKKRHE